MAILVEPAWEEGEATSTTRGDQRENLFVITGTSSREQALAALKAATLLPFGGLEPDQWRVRRMAEDLFEGRMVYGSGEDERPQQEGETEFSMTGANFRRKIKHSIETKQIKGRPGITKLPNFNRLLNVVRENGYYVPKGHEIGNEDDVFQITRVLSKAQMTGTRVTRLWSWRRTMNSAQVTMTVGNATTSFAPGELLYLHADLHYRRNDETWRETQHFSCEPNKTGFSVGQITGINKRGFDYLWFLDKPYRNPANDVFQIVPDVAYVEQIYEEQNHNLLAL